MNALDTFKEIWLVDFEYREDDGELPIPACMVVRQLRTGEVIRREAAELAASKAPPFATNASTLVVAFAATAECKCFLKLGWTLPVNVLDLHVEYLNMTNGKSRTGGGLLEVMTAFGLQSIAPAEKAAMRALAMRGGPYTADEMAALLDYCESDIVALAKLLPVMTPWLDIDRALLRGRWMANLAHIEFAGVPIDVGAYQTILGGWTSVQDALITDVDKTYAVYEGRTFKVDKFAAYLEREGIAWPRLPSGSLALDDDSFKAMARAHPQLGALRELRRTMATLRSSKLVVGSDGRNRLHLGPFRSTTGRNQPSTSKFIYGAPKWMRALIQPELGYALAYIDFAQQELGIAAALSKDLRMLNAYLSGDFYLTFAKQAGQAPADATKESHRAVRDQFKACALAVLYGAGEVGLAKSANVSVSKARELLALHKRTYPTFWSWSQGVVDHAMMHGYLYTTFGWTVHVGAAANPRSLSNFPMQGNGSEILRFACNFGLAAGVKICATVHDAVLIEATVADIDAHVELMRHAMSKASAVVLDGFELKTDVKVVASPDRMLPDDKDAVGMWKRVVGLLGIEEEGSSAAPSTVQPSAPVQSPSSPLENA